MNGYFTLLKAFLKRFIDFCQLLKKEEQSQHEKSNKIHIESNGSSNALTNALTAATTNALTAALSGSTSNEGELRRRNHR